MENVPFHVKEILLYGRSPPHDPKVMLTTSKVYSEFDKMKYYLLPEPVRPVETQKQPIEPLKDKMSSLR